MKLTGDFCYVIWFDNELDARYFLKIVSGHGRYAWLLNRSRILEWAVFWDIGSH